MYESKRFSFRSQVKYCLELGISADSASTLFIFIGLASSFSRVVTGRMCDISWINTIFVYQFGNLLVGLITICLLLIKDYKGMVVFAIVYGVGDGIFITTMNSLLVFTVEEKRRASALGLGNFLLSLGIAGGPPLAGENIFLIQDILLFKSVSGRIPPLSRVRGPFLKRPGTFRARRKIGKSKPVRALNSSTVTSLQTSQFCYLTIIVSFSILLKLLF